MNRIETAIAKMQAKLSTTDKEKVDKVDIGMNVGIGDYVQYQEVKSLAVASGKLTLEEGMTIYGILGNTPEHFNKQPAAQKIVITKVMLELLQMFRPNAVIR